MTGQGRVLYSNLPSDSSAIPPAPILHLALSFQTIAVLGFADSLTQSLALCFCKFLGSATGAEALGVNEWDPAALDQLWTGVESGMIGC